VTLTSGARRPLFFWFLIAGCALFALAVVMTVSVSIRHYGPIKAPGWVARPEYSGWFVTAIESGGPAEGPSKSAIACWRSTVTSARPSSAHRTGAT
jgi:hypothetical protein